MSRYLHFTIFCLVLAGPIYAQPSSAPLDEFLQTADREKAGLLALEILDEKPEFAELWAKLRAGIAFAATEPGIQQRSRYGQDGNLYHYLLRVPETYDPARAYPVTFYLHGGVSRETVDPAQNRWRNTDQSVLAEEISIYPHGWDQAMWWQQNQVENLQGILREVSLDLNVDHNRVYLAGVSDGASGVWFQAALNPTPFAAMFVFNSHPGVSANRENGVNAEVFPENLLNRSFFAVNGVQDNLYPADSIEPFLNTFAEIGISIEYHRQQDAGHNTNWWPDLQTAISNFATTHERNPYPELLHWHSAAVSNYNRIHWLVIDEVRPTDNSALDSSNPVLRADGERLYWRAAPGGRVLAQQQGNQFWIDGLGVASMRLLLFPDRIDFEAPVQVFL